MAILGRRQPFHQRRLTSLVIGAAAAASYTLTAGAGAFTISGDPVDTASLVAHYRLDEASGSRADVSGNAVTLTDNNTVTSAAGKIGSAAKFTAGNSESLSAAGSAALACGDIDFTLAGWVYLDTKASLQAFTALSDTGVWSHLLYYSSAADRLSFYVEDGVGGSATVRADDIGAVSTGMWYYLVAWHDAAANTINLQVNVGAVNSAAHSTGTRANQYAFTVGADLAQGNYADGRIDELSYWHRVLTSAERTALYNGGVGLSYPYATVLRVARACASGSGAYAWTGTDASLRAARLLSAGAGTYAITGAAARVAIGRMLAAGSGSYAWTGTDATLKATRYLVADGGVYAWTGTDVTFTAGTPSSATADIEIRVRADDAVIVARADDMTTDTRSDDAVVVVKQ